MPYPVDRYRRRVEQMRAHFEGLLIADVDDALANRVVFVSAVLSLLRPGLPRARHEAFVRDVAFYQAWAGFDESETVQPDGDLSGLDWLLETTTVRDSGDVVRRAAGGEAQVFCTAHLGSYRLLNAALAAAGVQFALVVDARTVAEQGERFTRSFQRIAARRGSPMRLALLDAEAGNVGLQVLRLLRRGVSVVFYIDGNTGTGGMARRDEGMTRVRFFGQTLYARRGIAYLAHTARAPLVPVLNERTAIDARTLTFHPPIAPLDGEDRASFSAAATQRVYDLLTEYLERVPTQWEGWLYVYRFLDTDALRPAEALAHDEPPAVLRDDDILSVDADRFALLRAREDRMLLDRATLSARTLSPAAHRLIDALSRPTRFGAVAAPDPATRALVARLLASGVLRSWRADQGGANAAPREREAPAILSAR